MREKSILTLCLIFSFFASYSQTEVVLSGGTEQDLKNAIATLNGIGTITIKGNIIIDSGLTVGEDIVLSVYNGNKLVIDPNAPNVKVDIKGYIEAGIYQIFDIPNEDHNVKIFNQRIFPEWFGKCSQKSDVIGQDDVPIQKAFNSLTSGGEIIFSGHNYLIKKTINIEVPSIHVKGKGTYFAGSDKTNNFSLSQDANPIESFFNIGTYGVRVSDLNFKGWKELDAEGKEKNSFGINATGIALKFVRSNGSKDLDGEVTNCIFSSFKFAIYGEGANLKITDNLFSHCYTGIYIKQALNENNFNHAHTRGHIINRNRFHSLGSYKKHPSLEGSACIKLIHDKVPDDGATGAQAYAVYGFYNRISENYADDCRTFFEGSVDRTAIEGNSILFSGGTAIKAFAGMYGSISNNFIDGSHTFNAHKLYPFKDSPTIDAFPSGHGIHVRNAHFLTINNNKVFNKRYHGIYIEKSKNSSIQSNTIMNFNRHRYVKISGVDQPVENDSILYDGIHIESHIIKGLPKYNIQNVVSNNVISIPHNLVEGRYGIYVGDGDDYNFVNNNKILSVRMKVGLVIQ